MLFVCGVEGEAMKWMRSISVEFEQYGHTVDEK